VTYKDVSLKEDDHQAHKNPIAMTIIRSMVINILHLCDVKSINEQLVKNRWDLNEIDYRYDRLHIK
jgi:hypothetical protein